MKIGLSVSVVSISAVAAVSSVSMSVDRPSYLSAAANPRGIIFSAADRPLIQPQTNLPSEYVSVGDGDGTLLQLQKDFETFKTEGPAITDADPVFDADKVLTDSVNVVETRVKVFTDFIDFDPSDADVDATPVTVSEADAKDVDKPLSDTATATESISNQPNIPKTDAVTTAEAINQFRPHKNVGLNGDLRSGTDVNRVTHVADFTFVVSVRDRRQDSRIVEVLDELA
jgi:hypothetical protein